MTGRSRCLPGCGARTLPLLGAFFHAVGVFFQHLAEVKWEALGLALACQVVKLGFRSYAWRSILRAAYPAQRLKLRTVFGAYVAGVGVNAVVPARAGDVVKMYLVKQRLQDASYATLAPTLIVETLFDFVVATGLLIWALCARRPADASGLLEAPERRLAVLRPARPPQPR